MTNLLRHSRNLPWRCPLTGYHQTSVLVSAGWRTDRKHDAEEEDYRKMTTKREREKKKNRSMSQTGHFHQSQ